MLASIYLGYFIITLGLTLWAGNVLHTSGRVFLLEHCKGNEEQADALNKLLLLGFYLFSFGFICLSLKYGTRPVTLDEGIEFLSNKVGFTVIVLGCIHFLGIVLRISMKP